MFEEFERAMVEQITFRHCPTRRCTATVLVVSRAKELIG
jgi:hypothetical protein